MRRLYLLHFQHLFNAVPLQQSINSWLLTTESLIQCHWMLTSSLLQHLTTESLCCLLIEDSLFLEHCKRICAKEVSPVPEPALVVITITVFSKLTFRP